MLELSGFVLVDENLNQIRMFLENNLTPTKCIPVFSSSEDAEKTWRKWCSLTGRTRQAAICELTTSGLIPVQELNYSED